jgi:hypothetical protein
VPVERKISEATQADSPISTAAELPTNYGGLPRKISVEQILLVGDTRFDAAGAASAVAGDLSDHTSLTTSAHGGLVPPGRTITAGTGLSGGGDLSADRTLSVSYGSTAGTACQGNDARLGAMDYWVRWWA